MDSSSSFNNSSDLRSKLFGDRRSSWFSALERAFETFTPGERLLLYILTLMLAISSFSLLASANAAVSVTVPERGGELVEGVIGPARFINPLLALSEPDRDISALIYAGLMRVRPDGSLAPDLAARYEVSEDRTTYTFTLRPNLTFHDGTPLTAEDVVYTIQRAQDQQVKSTKRADWDGVQVTNPDTQTIVFKLPRPYAPFLENTTIGILPKHIWEGVVPEEFPFTPLNTHPIGSGPYRFLRADTNPSGSITRFEVASFKNFGGGEPFLRKIVFVFYPNEEARINAYNAGRIDSLAGLLPADLSKISSRETLIVRAALPRVFGVFFNQNKNPALGDLAARSAINAAIDKQKLVNEILGGYGSALTGPIPPHLLGSARPAIPERLAESATLPDSPGVEAQNAQAILSEAGWTFNETGSVWVKKDVSLVFTLATADEPELQATAEALVKQWAEAGIKVDLQVYPISELNSMIIRPRNYDAVLFGEVVGRTLDIFAFWHSSQRNDPGLNLALYTNSRVDTLLLDARSSIERKEREKLFEEFSTIIAQDQPAVFLYAPEFLYVVPKGVNGIALPTLTSPEDRFMNIHEWYTDTERVWSIFAS